MISRKAPNFGNKQNLDLHFKTLDLGKNKWVTSNLTQYKAFGSWISVLHNLLKKKLDLNNEKIKNITKSAKIHTFLLQKCRSILI